MNEIINKNNNAYFTSKKSWPLLYNIILVKTSLTYSINLVYAFYWKILQYYAAQEMIAAYDPLYDQIDRPQPPVIDQPVAYPGTRFIYR